MEIKTKILKVRKRIPATNSEKNLPKKKFKVARKITDINHLSPIPTSVQEDFILESEQNPIKFLVPCHSNPDFEIFSNIRRGCQKKLTLSPTNIIGPIKSYQQKAKIDDMNLERKFTKFHFAFRKMITKKPSFDLDEKIKIYKNSIKATDFTESSPKIMTPGAKMAYKKQEKILHQYELQKRY